MAIKRMLEGQTTKSVVRSLVGKHIVLNVTTSGDTTSVCTNIQQNGRAAWRRREKDKKFTLNLDWPGFSVTPESLVFSYDDINAYANSFQHIREAFPDAAFGPNGKVAIGKLPQDKGEMGAVLAKLERLLDSILEIEDCLSHSLDTPMYRLRRALPHNVNLIKGDELSEYAQAVLAAFVESQQIYARLPELTGFGTANVRGQERPGPRDQLLRWYMQHNPQNPLHTTPNINYVEYELKPLNISDRLKWTCSSDPRTESIDDLLALSGSPVLTEVKMRGDRLVSHAVVQLLYYASIMANTSQNTRLNREIQPFHPDRAWLCVIVEERTNEDEPLFETDLRQALAFLNHRSTTSVLAPFYSGFIILVIREQSEPFCATRNIPAFRVIDDGQHVISFDVTDKVGSGNEP